MVKIERNREIATINRFVKSPKSDFAFLRGRRRVGKTWLLKEFQSKAANCFYFMGSEDSDDQGQRRDFAEAWSEFSQDNSLLELADQFRSWQRIFKQVTEYAKRLENIPLILLFDEIQCIAKKIQVLFQSSNKFGSIGNV